jgi:GrpB-like predicted nucleotidyltransferase (UPF0157 family)
VVELKLNCAHPPHKVSAVLRPFPVILAEYNPDWPFMAADHTRRLQVLGPALLAVHHIGSTAVPNLIAKPIVDLMPLVTSVADLDQRRHSVEALGYNWHGEHGISGRRYCTLDGEKGQRVVQLHFFEAGSPQVDRHLAFRDYLRAHPEVARVYAMEKRRARNLHPDDSYANTDEKAAWIRKAEAMAIDWYAEYLKVINP